MPQKIVPKEVVPIAGFQGIELTVYGVKNSKSLSETLEQGYFVSVEGKPTARADLPEPVRNSVMVCLQNRYPEHARI